MPTIEDVRKQYPQYSDVDDVTLATALHSKYYSDMNVNEFMSKLGVEEGFTGNEFTRGFQRGVATTKSLVTEGVPAVAKGLINQASDFMGAEPLTDPTENLLKYQEEVNKAFEKYPTKVPSVTDIDTLGDIGSYIASAAGEQVPQLGLSLFSGGLTGLGAKQGIKELAKRQGKKLTEQEVNKVVKQGIAAGTLASSGAQNIPETYFNLLSQGGDDALTSVLLGGLKSGLDVIPQMELLRKVLGDKASDVVVDSLFKTVIKQGGKTAISEGVTESAQEGIDLLAEQFVLENKELFTPENLVRLVDSGLKGAIGGGLAGAGAAPLIAAQSGDRPAFDYEKLSPKQKEKLNQKFEEEIIGEAAKTTINADAKTVGLDDTIITPAYLNNAIFGVADSIGVSKESLVLVPPQDIEATQGALNRLTEQNATDLYQVYSLPESMANVASDLVTRREAIKQEKRTDTNFIPGDGEIVLGAPVNPTTSLRNSHARMKTTDSTKVQKVVAKEVPVPTQVLPKQLSGAKPKWKTSKLEFASDLDRAAYIVSNPKHTAKKHQEYLNWLTKATGKSEAEVIADGKAIRNRIKELDKKEPNQEVISVPARIKQGVKLQKINLPFNGNLRDDLVVPSLVSNNLKGIPLTDLGNAKINSVIQQTQRIIKEVAGPAARLEPFSRLVDGFNNEPVAGAQFSNVIAVAFNENTLATVEETAYHEIWHFLESIGAFTKKEIAIIAKQTARLMEYMNQDGYLSNYDFQVFLSTPTGREELRANAFGKWMKEQRKGVEASSALPSSFKVVFRKVKNILERLGNALNGLGFKSLDDIFHSVLEGNRAQDTINDISYTNRIARFQKIAEEFQDVHNKEMAEKSFEDIVKDARIQSNKRTRIKGKHIGVYTQYLRSFVDAASHDPFLAEIYSSTERKVLNSSKYLEGYLAELGKFPSMEKAIRHRLHDLADYLRSSKQKATIDEEGRLVFERDGKIVRLNDPELGKAFTEMQNAYGKVLSDYETLLKEKAFEELGEDILISPNFGLQQVLIARDNLTKSGENAPKTKVERLNKLAEVLAEIANMRRTTFVPHMRFGSWGFTVRDKETKEQVGFYTVEGGSFRKLYNKFQLENTLKELKEKYSDTSKYEIVGENGVIKQLTIDNMVPFNLTHNEFKNNIDPRFINLELLSSLLASKDVDMEAYEKLRSEVYNDILERGFEKRFSQSKNIDGYSKDWDRVQHAYLSGASHYLAGLRQQSELGVLERETRKLADPKLKKKALRYLEYTNSPSEDFVMVRSFNFLWTMGGNFSTAALQIMTLPTTTLGSMTQYNANILQNMKYIGKWTKIAIDFYPSVFKTVQTHNGMLYADFTNDEVINGLISKGKMSEVHANFLRKVAVRFRGFQTEEYSGFKPFETRSLGGGIKANLSTAANYLGLPISTMEQITRFATTMATFDMLSSNINAQKRARKALKNDYRFQAQLKHHKEMDFLENVATFSMDEAHAVFGKQGRAEFQRGLGGAFVFPFMTYPQQALEFLMRSYGRGVEGKIAMATTLSSLFILSGLMGLPGAELLKELLEEVEKQLTGSEEDFDFLIREKIYEQTGDVKFAKFITQGVGRAYADLDVSRRIGLPIPGQDILMLMLGIRGDATGVLGVSGSLLESMALAWNEYNNDGSAVNVLSAITPVAPANLLKAYQMSQEGVKTRKGTQLVTPEDLTAKSIAARAFGVTSDQIATKREELYARMLFDNKYTTAIERFRTRAKNTLTKLERARTDKDFDRVKKLEREYSDIIDELYEYSIKNEIAPDFRAFNRSVRTGVAQRLDTTIKPKDARALARKEFLKVQEALLGVED